MYTAKDIWDSLYEQHNAEDDANKKAQIRREVRKAYHELSGRIPWRTMIDEVEYDLTANADGIWMSPDLCDIIGVGNSEERWSKATKRGALKDNIAVRMYYEDDVSFTPIASGADITISSGATTFTGGASITADMVGEYIRFAGQDTSHKLASTTSIETPYYGDDLTGSGAYEVRPAGSKKIKLVTPSGLSDSENPVIYFWAKPSQLYVESQLMLLPTSALLELGASVKIFTIEKNKAMADDAKKDLYGSKGRYEGELSRAEAMNPEFIMPGQPVSYVGTAAGFGSHDQRRTW